MCGDRHVIESMCDRVCGKVHLQRPHIGVAAFQFYCCALQSRGCIHWAGKTAKKKNKVELRDGSNYLNIIINIKY